MNRQNNALIAERLRFLWSRDNIQGPADAAREYGIGFESIKKIGAAERGMTVANAERIAAHHKASPGWLMFGEGSPDGKMTVPLIGSVAAGQQLVFYEDSEKGIQVDAYFGAVNTVAFEVVGDSMFPLARAGDYVYFLKPTRDVERLVGREAFVQIEDGNNLFKILQRGSRAGRYDLISYNAEPIRDRAVHAAGRFLGVRRVGR